MISVSTAQNDTKVVRCVLRPDRSMSSRGIRIALTLVAVPSLSASAYFALQGLWVPLPIAGIELTALAVCTMMLRRRLCTQVEIELGPDEVRVERTGPKGKSRWSFQSAWAKIRLVRPGQRWYPKRLLIGAHGREVEVGEFLTEREREKAARALKQALNMHTAWRGA